MNRSAARTVTLTYDAAQRLDLESITEADGTVVVASLFELEN
jgi:hypothetical protein